MHRNKVRETREVYIIIINYIDTVASAVENKYIFKADCAKPMKYDKLVAHSLSLEV